MRAPLLMIVVALLAASSAAAKPLKLNSGIAVEVDSVGPIRFAKSPPALYLRYTTQKSIDDLASVRKEVDEIWQHFVVDADRGKFDNAVIMANGAQTGAFIKTGKAYGFIFKKLSGNWRTVESETTPQTKLTEAQVRAFLDRWDWLLMNHNERALALYLDPAWRLYVSGDPDGSIEETVEEFLKNVERGRGQTKLLSHDREVVSIKIDAGTNTAHVESRETTKRVFENRPMLIVERTTEDIALREGILLILKSTSVIEKLEGTPSSP